MTSNLYRVGRYAARRPWVVIGAWLVVAALVVAASGAFGKKLEESFGAPGVDSQYATDLLSAAGADQAGLTAQVVVTPLDEQATLNGPELRAALTQIRSTAASLPHVLGVGDPVISPDGRVGLIRLQYPVLDKLEPSDLEQLKTLTAVESPLRIELGGDLFYAFEEAQAGLGEAFGLIAAMVILLLAFGSIIAMGLPVGMAVFGLALAISSLSLVTYLIDLPSWAPVLGSMIGLGVGIDYALIIVTRHRENLGRGMEVEESVGHAVATAGQAVLFAGGTVVIAILGLVVAGVPFMTAGGIAISLIVLTMVLASLTLLPAFLGLAGHWINRLRVRRVQASPGSGWRRWAGHVSKHAAAYAVGATVLLLALAAPVLALRVGTPDDGALPVQRTERRAYDLVAAGFGAGSNGPLVIAVDVSRDPTVVQPLFNAVRADRGIASVGSPQVNTAAGVATLIAVPTTGPQDDATMTTVERLRAEVFPSVLRDSPAKAHVGGQTATLADVGAKVNDRLAWFIGAVILLSVVLLTVVFRSVVVPLKAAAMNLLSIGASFGVMVMIFQWGWAADLIGLESTIPILPFIPMFMFAVVFGLSMDYEVFLLTRIREEYVRTGDNTTSTIHGITTTGRVITSAALIMIAVFVSFSLADDPTAKMFGLGLATAVLIDATIVRLVLVPALMKLLGDANWWMPAWLNRPLVTGVGVIGDRNRDHNGQRRRPTGPTGESNRAMVHPDSAGTAVELKAEGRRFETAPDHPS
ncbi:RND superfamily putative drug exporter [Kribbella orskensis]|uniref:RND superfamily putative drug exporter n=2 Tax=Kribbellaceae TaxID=2726069 RepID=A0ABY2B8T0_9ACTN|nr:RND superfamily putative drug exporter [Kribbella sp. VKM Ac-2500]TCO09083.1 RND superfamily putative drug exporter [Kribbella orskensis]